MSTGIAFAGAAQDDEFEALLQETYKRYAVDDPFSHLVSEPPSTSALLPGYDSQFAFVPNSLPQASEGDSPQSDSEIEVSDHLSEDQDYKPTKGTKYSSVSESSTSEKDPVKKKSKARSLIQPDDLKDYHKGIERLQKALAKFKEDSKNKAIPEDLSAKERKAWERKENNKLSAQVGRYKKAISELEEKIELKTLMDEKEKLAAMNRELLRANAELNSRLTIMQNTPADTVPRAALDEDIASLKRTHQASLKSFAELKEKAQASQEQSDRQTKEAEENIDSLCKKLTALKEVESYSHDLKNQLQELSVEKKQLEKMLDEAKIAKQQPEENQYTLNQTFQELVARYEAERKTYLTKMHAKFEQDLRPLQARVASLTAQEEEHVQHIQWLKEKIQRLESQYHQQSVDYDVLGEILQRREVDYCALESHVGSLEERGHRDRAYIQNLEAELASFRQERTPNPPLVYSSRAPIDRFFNQPQTSMRGTTRNKY